MEMLPVCSHPTVSTSQISTIALSLSLVWTWPLLDIVRRQTESAVLIALSRVSNQLLLVQTPRSLVGGTTPSLECASSFSGTQQLLDRESILRTISELLNTVRVSAEIVSWNTSNTEVVILYLACSRGAPEYVHRSSFLEQTPITGCSQTSSCSHNFECKSVGSTQWCCPSVASVCGPIGGRPLDPSVNTRGTVYHTGVEKQGTATSTRFFYDPQSGKCSPFTYLGAGGNYNNFLSRIDCELYCARCELCS